MNRFVYMIAMVLCILSLQFCSGSDDGYPTLARPEPDPVLYQGGPESGYAKVFNARLVVNTVDTYEGAPENEWLVNAFLGLGLPDPPLTAYGWDEPPEGSDKTTNIYLNPLGEDIYIHYPTFTFTIMGYKNLGYSLKYSKENDAITIEGKTFRTYTSCPLLDLNGWDQPEGTTLLFQGSFVPTSNSYEGNYTWIQESVNTECNITCSGSMTLMME